tara:strand:+ start:632 stop:943 length:312 start_codon:yes stop_codon:yes gene_type:complete
MNRIEMNVTTGVLKNIPFTDSELVIWTSEKVTREAEEAAYLAGADDRAAADARDKRNDLLAATDWTANSDVTMTTEMTAYRQALRDVPTQAGWPTTINWPTAP